MKKNMGSFDRTLRIILAIVVGILIFTNQLSGLAAVILSIIAIIFLITGFVGFCPLYAPFKIQTIEKTRSKG